jgi:hypothetical protein
MGKVIRLTESDLKKIIGRVLISEASKIKVLTDKIGLNERNAEVLDRLCGPLSVWMANKWIDYNMQLMSRIENQSFTSSVPSRGGEKVQQKFTKQDVVKSFNSTNFFNSSSVIQSITSVMDYIRVGLNGNASPIKDLDIEKIIDKSEEWHKSLEIGKGEINYVEPHTNDILIDNRDENGIGFYWVDLNTNSSDQECNRMGHCGRTQGGNTIWSLRETKKVPGTKYTLNKSHLTAAVGNDGILYQLKGPKNSKPKEEYHNLITPIFYISDDDGYIINGFGSEYASNMDFKLTDLPDNTIKSLYQDRPDLFNTRSLKRKLVDMGVIEAPEINWFVEVEIDADRLDNYVNGDWTVRKSKRKTPSGGEYTVSIGIFETILAGETWDLWDNYDADWKSALEYEVDEKNEKKIWELVKKMAGEEFDEDLSLRPAIEEYDGDNEIRRAISSAVNEAESSEYQNYLYKTLKDCLEEYGEVLKMDDTGVKLRVDVSNFIDSVGEDYLDDYMENCNDDIKCLFEELVGQGDITRPKFYVDDRWYPSINTNEFNEILSDRLLDI